MNFTRDPIIETIITPRQGYKLLLRNVNMAGAPEYLADALEIVSIASACFFRSQDAGRNFLLPVQDYEITETKEAKMVLKGITVEKEIKIGGGKKAPEEPTEPKKKKRPQKKKPAAKESTKKETAEPKAPPEEKRALIPPPTTLISEGFKKEQSSPAEVIESADDEG